MQTTKFAPWVPERLVFSHFLLVPRLYYSNSMFNTFGKSLNRLIYIQTLHRTQHKSLTDQFWRNVWFQNHEFVNSLKLSKIIWNIQMFFRYPTLQTLRNKFIFLQRLIKKHTLFPFLGTVSLFRQENIWFTLNDSYDKTIIGWSRSSWQWQYVEACCYNFSEWTDWRTSKSCLVLSSSSSSNKILFFPLKRTTLQTCKLWNTSDFQTFKTIQTLSSENGLIRRLQNNLLQLLESFWGWKS